MVVICTWKIIKFAGVNYLIIFTQRKQFRKEENNSLCVSVRCFIVIREATNQNKPLNLAAVITFILNVILGLGKSRSVKQLGITTEQFFRWLYAVVFYTF